ncbi:hydrogenase accessory protein HypB [Candidatus Wirthbacteria bacterium CG2_30_54_11]|uniref:Hydrogenase accessory protein HypB n=1 Tax=Candidatus Wirthbacteria bacterium CG2_30_54_11 TaxID=1817892 RepID=A0A1J5IFR3_9BACT|nr:MAG: hydrogenase accessory protein HypB [Candidatus Wirthbacteria bacterium CG2_30_54_11]
MAEVILNKNLQSENNRIAAANRKTLKKHGIWCLNIMGSPGAGKTALLEKTAQKLKKKYEIAVIEGDMATTNDRDRVLRNGIPAVQITTRQYKSSCHMNAFMVADVLHLFDLASLDILIIENVGNLVCPAEFDLGEDKRLVVLSITEGEDKPLKYPVMFNRADAVALNKMDLQFVLKADLPLTRKNIRACNPQAEIFEVSARAEGGLDTLVAWIESQIKAKKAIVKRGQKPARKKTRK